MPSALLVLAAATEEPVPTPTPTPVPTEEPVVVPTEEPVVVPTEEPASTPAPTDVPDDLENIDRADVIIPGKPTFEMDKATAELGENITFTIHTKNATKILMYIDGSVNRYIYDVKDGATTFQMSFSTLGSNGGVRTVAFQPYNGSTPGAMSDTKTITISVANKPRVELLKISNPNATLGENITFTLRIKNATKVLMYIDGSVNRRFENITPDMTEYTFTMAFSSLGNNGGKRTIAFQAYNGAVGGDKTSATTISLMSGSSAAPVIANVKIDKTTAVLGEQIKFTVYLDNATKLLMYVDGQVNRRFEDVTTSMSKYEFTMSFSSLGNNGGVRTIQFQPYNGTTAGEKFKAYTITLTTTVVNKPEVVNFTMNPSRVKLNVPVTFTVNTKNATKVVLYVDGKANTSYPTTGDVTVIERAFASLGSGNGVRTIQFKPYYGTTAGELSPAQSLTLYVTDDPLTVTVPAAKQGDDLTVTWTAAGGAAKYQLLLTTPGIDADSGDYTEFGIPATILAHYLRENGIVPEKCDLNSILFLLTPAESAEKLARLVAMLAQFEQHIEADSPLAEVLPTIFNKYPVRYRDYTIRQLCQEMHDLYVSFDVKDLQKAMFRKQSFPPVVMNPQDANREFIRGNVELVRLSEAEGRIAAEGALPYPPGVLCVVPGELWGGAVLRYFLALEEGVNMLPGFSPELQGVYSETDTDGIKRLYGYVLKK